MLQQLWSNDARSSASKRRRRSRLGMALLIALPLAVTAAVPASAAPPGPPPGPPPLCSTDFSGGGGDLSAQVANYLYAPAPGTTAAMAADAVVMAAPRIAFYLRNDSPVAVSNPTITVNSAYAPGLFTNLDGPGSPPLAGFPISCSLPSLPPGQLMRQRDLTGTGIPMTYTPGFDSTYSVSPTVVPPGGGQQTVTASITPRDPVRFGGPHWFTFGLADNVISRTMPGNLGQGETVCSPCGNGGALGNAVIGKTYTFVWVVQVVNSFDRPWTHAPMLKIGGQPNGTRCAGCALSGPTVTIPVPDLDGPQPGSGSVSFSISEGSHAWNSASAGTSYGVSYGGGLFGDLLANEDDQLEATQPRNVDSTPSTQSFNGSRTWTFRISNRSGGTVTAPTISVATGLDPSLLVQSPNTPVTSSPIVSTQPSLGSLQEMQAPPLIGSTVAVQFQPGYNSSRSMTPLVIPVGGGQQTLAFTVQPVDPAIWSFNIGFQDNLGSTVVSSSGPTNLDQGEQLCGSFGGLVSWNLCRVVTGKAYTFTAVLQVPNPFGVPFVHRPSPAAFGDHWLPGGCIGCGGPTTSVTLADSSLDGSIPGSGQITYSIAEAGHNWEATRAEQRVIRYAPTGYSRLVNLTPVVRTGGDTSMVAARLFGGGVPLAGGLVSFRLGSGTCSGLSAADGMAACSLDVSDLSGAQTLTVSFAGNDSFYPSSLTSTVTLAECGNQDGQSGDRGGDAGGGPDGQLRVGRGEEGGDGEQGDGQRSQCE